MKADNDHGQDQADVEVVVMVAPTKPKGPLKVSDIYAEGECCLVSLVIFLTLLNLGCTIEWGPPEDDGGTAVTNYIVEKAEGASTTWYPCGRTNGDTTKCQVVGLKPEKEHRIQVYAVNAEGDSEPLECVDSFVTENPFATPGAPGKPECIGGDFDNFEMKWEEPRNDGGSRINGYELQARAWKESNWWRAGEDRHSLCRYGKCLQ